MSKTFDANSLAQTAKTFWKRCVASGTAWLREYREDPFFRTETNVIALQVPFAAVIVAVIGVSFSLLYHGVTVAIIEGMRASLASDSPESLGPMIVQEIREIRAQTLWTVIGVIVAITAIFGYIVARIALKPTRNALAAQKQFIGNVAHELRTPLAIIKTNTEVALFDRTLSKDLKEILESTVEELDRISQIINNLLSLSALVRPENMEFSSVDFSSLVSSVVDKYRQLASAGEIEIAVRKSSNMRVWGNTTALEQIVGNVVKNAINYTPKGGRVSITLELALNDHVELVVQDSGVGIAQRDLFRIFEPFYRADPSRTRVQNLQNKGSGTGLGLTIVSELVRTHEGKITIRSAVGRGTTVTILLPGAREHAATGLTETNAAPNEVAMDFSH